MFARMDAVSPGTAAPETPGGAADVTWLLDAVTSIDCNASDAVLIDRIAALERLKCGAAAAQARLTAAFADSQTADAAARKHRPDAAARSIAGQIALARRDSVHAGRRHVGVAAALVSDQTHTLAALARGELSERRAHAVVEQLACLTRTDRREADRLLAPDLAGMSDRTAESLAAAMAYRLDPAAVMAKVRGAVKDRHVSLRPAPETMSRLSALLPVAMGVAVYAALSRAADSATAAPGGDPRNRGQLMADALVSAVTGQQITGCDDYGVPQYAPTAAPADTRADHCTAKQGSTTTPTADTKYDDCAASAAGASADDANDDAATDDDHADPEPATDNAAATATATDLDGEPTDDAAEPEQTETDTAPPATTSTAPAPGTAVAVRGCTGGCGLNISLMMTDRTLLDGDDEPAYLHGHGPIPAPLARALVIGAADSTTRTWIRRFYTDPGGGLTAMDSTRRLFPPAAKRFLLARDQTCRTPWCDAPIRQYDHVVPHAQGGPTSRASGQGLCQACNLTKQAPGWTATPKADGEIRLTVPTGQTYTSRPPRPPRSRRWNDYSAIQHELAKLLGAA